eukprot:Skav226214  [mRNA]  locus=scaffold2208:606805:608329:- [translate_table: standard]
MRTHRCGSGTSISFAPASLRKSAQASVDALKAGLEKKMPVKRRQRGAGNAAFGDASVMEKLLRKVVMQWPAGNGKFDSLPVVQVVPGDILFMRGGDIVPADCYWLEGDPCQVDEAGGGLLGAGRTWPKRLVDGAALTGESLPVKVPRKDDAGKPCSGRQMWSGSILKVERGAVDAAINTSHVDD